MTIDFSRLEQDACTLGKAHEDHLAALRSACQLGGSRIAIANDEQVREHIGVLARVAAFGSPDGRVAAHRLALELAHACGIFPASIDALYRDIAAGKATGFTVPAINMRAIAFESARGVFRAMRENDVGASIFELSRGEIGFTAQRPHEYATAILCAAVTEQHQGPLFLQGDHFQVSATRYAQNPQAEIAAIKALIAEAVNAGFYNIDIDSSTLVDLSLPTLDAQQALNAQLTADLASFTRQLEPAGVTISIGGEIGEVGEDNSTVAEVRAYLAGVAGKLGSDCPGLSKLSIQSGTRHGGNVLPDGSFGDMNVDFALIADLTSACRTIGGLAGSVQHGASMLSLEKIGRLPAAGCIEVHLAAAFLNVVYDELPREVVDEADHWAKTTHGDEWKSDWSEAQFLHHARRYPIGPFKRQWWAATAQHEAIRNSVTQKASAYFDALNVRGTRALVRDAIAPVYIPWAAYMPSQHQANDEATIEDLAS